MSASNYIILSLEQKVAELETRLAATEQTNSDLLVQVTKLAEAVDEIGANKRARVDQAAAIAAIHSQYPIETEFDKGYAEARSDAAKDIRERTSQLNNVEEIQKRHVRVLAQLTKREANETKPRCDCWRHGRQVCDICQGSRRKIKQEYRHDEWCHSVIEGEECSCGVRLFQEKDGRIAELTSERDALLRDVHWLTMDKEGLREGAEVVGHELAEVRRERDELRSKVAGLEHALVDAWKGFDQVEVKLPCACESLLKNQSSKVEEIQKRYAPGLEEMANGVTEYIGTITDLGRKLGEANQREKVLRDRVALVEGILLAIELPQGQAYPAAVPEAKS